jgi:STE24 endopeptidase
MDREAGAQSYHRWQLWLSIAGLCLAAAYLIVLIATSAAVTLRDWLSSFSPHWWLQLPVALIMLGGGYRVVALPLRWFAGFWLPRRFGLLHQPFHRWLWDSVKATLIGGILALLGATIVYGFMRVTPWWWLWSAGIFLVGSALLAWIAPIWLAPLFYELIPLDDAALRDRLLRMAEKAGVRVLGVWVADQSRKSRTANAAVVGLGSTRRIVLFDTLIREFTPDEVEAVLAHELAHHVHRDVVRGLLVQSAVTLATFWAANQMLDVGSRWLGLDGPADLAALPLFGLILMALGLVALPIANGWSRHVERQADDFALHTAGDPEAFIGAMDRLGDLNLAERDPHRVKEFLLYSHPSVARRIARARMTIRSPH